MPESLIIRSNRIVAEGAIRPGAIHIRAGKIDRVDFADNPAVPKDAPTLDAGDLAVLPGLVDTHVHVNEPGRTDWEGFETAGRAAAAGGITSIVVMPLNCTPAATNVPALLAEAAAANGKCLVDYGLWGGLIPGNTDQLEPMWRAANGGLHGFKCFLVDSGVDDFPPVTFDDLLRADVDIAKLGGPLLVHAEDPELIAAAAVRSGLAQHPSSYAHYLASRPPESESRAVAVLAGLCHYSPLTVHIVHVSSVPALEVLMNDLRPQITEGAPLTVEEEAEIFRDQEGRRFTAETCPHYLTFAAEEIPDGATQFKCAPPIRDAATRERLWNALRSGVLSMVVSDHSPCPPSLKRLDEGDFAKAWGGISSLQVSLAATWTGAHQRGFELSDIARWMAERPAILGGFNHRKGRIAPGFDADLILFDPEESWTVDASKVYHRHKLTPYDGLTLRGVVKRTILRGQTIFDASLPNPFPTNPIGQWLKRGTP